MEGSGEGEGGRVERAPWPAAAEWGEPRAPSEGSCVLASLPGTVSRGWAHGWHGPCSWWKDEQSREGRSTSPRAPCRAPGWGQPLQGAQSAGQGPSLVTASPGSSGERDQAPAFHRRPAPGVGLGWPCSGTWPLAWPSTGVQQRGASPRSRLFTLLWAPSPSFPESRLLADPCLHSGRAQEGEEKGRKERG